MSTSSGAQAQAATPIGPAGQDASFTTVFKSTVGIEGLTGDGHGNLYTAGRGVGSCPVTRVPAAGGAPVLVGSIPAPCGPAGLTFNADGRLFITNGDTIVALRPSASNPPTATVFATGVPGANGVAFDRDGNLWTGDGTTGQGRVWRVGPDGGAGTEVFRVQPMVNEVNVAGGVDGIALDRAGNLYAAANERNAIVVVTPAGRVVELFRNAPDGSTSLRNGGPLEFPTSPFLTGSKLCVTSSDGARRDNFPNGGGRGGAEPGRAGQDQLPGPAPGGLRAAAAGWIGQGDGAGRRCSAAARAAGTAAPG